MSSTNKHLLLLLLTNVQFVESIFVLELFTHPWMKREIWFLFGQKMSNVLESNIVSYVCACGHLNPITKLFFCRHCLKPRCGFCVCHEVSFPLIIAHNHKSYSVFAVVSWSYFFRWTHTFVTTAWKIFRRVKRNWRSIAVTNASNVQVVSIRYHPEQPLCIFHVKPMQKPTQHPLPHQVERTHHRQMVKRVHQKWHQRKCTICHAWHAVGRRVMSACPINRMVR